MPTIVIGAAIGVLGDYLEPGLAALVDSGARLSCAWMLRMDTTL